MYMENLKKLWPYAAPFSKELGFGPLFKFIEAIIDLLVPLAMAKVIDIGIPAGDQTYVLKMGGLILLMGAVGLIFATIAQYCAAKASMGFSTGLRNDLFRHVLQLSPADVDKEGSATLITRISIDVANTQRAIAIFIRAFTRAPMILLGSTVMVMIINLKLSMLFLAAMVLILLTLYLVMTRSVPYYTRIQKWVDGLTRILRENLEGVRVIRAFDKQAGEEARFQQTSDLVMGESIRVGKLSALLNPLTYAITNIAVIVILWAGSIDANAGLVTSGELIALINYLSQILLSLMTMGTIIPALNRAYASAKRVISVMETVPSQEETESPAAEQPPACTPFLAFDDVSFSYVRGGAEALSHITFSVEKGETVGIIGGTGSGKTTLVQLIPRLYDVSAGTLFLAGNDIKDYPFAEIRGKVGVVPQKAVLFAGTLRENIRWGKQDATDEEIWAALDTAQASEFVRKLPEGLDSPVLQGGKNFSGGQRQRLTIARALVRRPEILILDDAASALDFATDAALRKAIRTFSRGMTVFLVSQRAGSIRYADKIIVLDDGRIAGIGTHSTLFADCQVYREICLSQFSEQEAQGE